MRACAVVVAELLLLLPLPLLSVQLKRPVVTTGDVDNNKTPIRQHEITAEHLLRSSVIIGESFFFTIALIRCSPAPGERQTESFGGSIKLDSSLASRSRDTVMLAAVGNPWLYSRHRRFHALRILFTR